MAGLSFSGAFRWINCPGSKVMCQQGLRLPQSEEAKQGTLAHKVAADLLLGKPLPPDADKDMVRYGQQYAALVDTLSRAYGCTGGLHVEKRWTHPADKRVRGEADVIRDRGTGELLLVGDYKYGEGTPVSAEGNPQLLATAITRLRELGREASAYKGALVFIYQPRSVFGETFTSDFVPFAKLVEFEAVMLEAAKASDDPNAPLVPGDWCKMCSAKVICPKFVEENFTPIAEMPALTGYSLQELGPLLVKAKAVKPWIEDLEKYVKHAMSIGYLVPGWEVKPRNGARQWKDPVSAEFILEGLLGEKRFKKPTLLSPTQVLEQYGELAETLKPHIEQPIYPHLKRSN